MIFRIVRVSLLKVRCAEALRDNAEITGILSIDTRIPSCSSASTDSHFEARLVEREVDQARPFVLEALDENRSELLRCAGVG